MFCKSCGKQIDNDSVFCSFCGTRLSDIHKPNSENFVATQDGKTLNVNLSFEKPKQPRYDPTYEKENGATIFGVVLLVISLILVSVGSFKFEDEISYRQFKVFTSIGALVLRIVVIVFVVDIAKRQNREPFGWGVLSFFLPSIALIIIGQLRKFYKPNEEPIDLLSEEQSEPAFETENIEIPRIVSIKNDKITFVDGTITYVIKDKQERHFFVSNSGRHYYKTQDTAIRAAYIYKVTNKISKVDGDD